MGLFSNAPVTVESVLDDLKGVDDNKSKLMQNYSDKQKEVLGGLTKSDLPIDGNHEYYILDEKKRILNGLPT